MPAELWQHVGKASSQDVQLMFHIFRNTLRMHAMRVQDVFNLLLYVKFEELLEGSESNVKKESRQNEKQPQQFLQFRYSVKVSVSIEEPTLWTMREQNVLKPEKWNEIASAHFDIPQEYFQTLDQGTMELAQDQQTLKLATDEAKVKKMRDAINAPPDSARPKKKKKKAAQ